MKDFGFYVQCNECPIMRINVVADNIAKAKQYVKDMYAAQNTIYADERFNIWSIQEV